MKVLKKKRLVNSGRRKLVTRKRKNPTRRKMTAKQIKYFGTARQKAALKSSRKRRRNGRIKKLPLAGKPRRSFRKALTSVRYAKKFGKSAKRKGSVSRADLFKNPRRRKRRSNPSSIVSVTLPSILGMNPGRKRRKVRRNSGGILSFLKGTNNKPMAKRRKRASHRRNPIYRGKTTGAGRKYLKRTKGAYVYTSNPRRRRYSRRANPSRRHYSRRRRNPGILSGRTAQWGVKIAGFFGGFGATHVAMGFVPSQFAGGYMGLFASALVATLQARFLGPLASKVIGANVTPSMQFGGYTYVGLQVLNTFFPGVAAQLGIRGVGVLARSSFYTPQVPRPGSMTQFFAPATTMQAIAAAIPAGGMAGVGNPGAKLTRVGL